MIADRGYDAQQRVVDPLEQAGRGHKVHGLQNAQQRPRTSLIGGYREHKLMAPMLFEGTCNTEVFNQWLEHMLLPQWASGSTMVLDNASF
ncbi:MAG: transposase, partial [Burkholderiaceae bacterium]|nr:transposase [Burkholderiaceae bacterium]